MAQWSRPRSMNSSDSPGGAGWREVGAALFTLWALGRLLKQRSRERECEEPAPDGEATRGHSIAAATNGRLAADGADVEEHRIGRRAKRPREIPRAGWRDILLRVKSEMAEDHLSIVAAGVAFYAFLALFPAIAALVSIYGLITSPADLQQHLQAIEAFLPADAARLIDQELLRVVQAHESELGWGAVAGMALALWSAAKGMKSLMEGLNIVYDEEEKRGFLKLNAVALLLTLGAILLVIVFLGLVVGVPVLLRIVGLGEVGRLVDVLRWPLLALSGMAAIAVIYRYGPSRDKAQWQWVSWGSATATLLWLLGSSLFSFYVSNFAGYNATYGSIGVVVVLMMWFLLSVYSILLGGEINAEMERQTAEDTTEGKPEPMGQRGAYAADTLGPRP